MNDKIKNFLIDSDKTGRFIVKSLRTGRKYYVEPIGSIHNSGWGDQIPGSNPGTMTGDYGDKYPGCVDPKDSIITAENGFSLIEEIGPGISPLSIIEERDRKYPDEIS